MPSFTALRHNLWTLVKKTAVDSRDDRVPGLAGEVAFFALLSVPPGLLAVLAVSGFVAQALGPDAVMQIRDEVISLSRTFLTGETIDEVVRPGVDRILESGRADVASLGIVLSVWSASRATRVVMRTVVIAYDQTNHRSAVRERATAVGITLAGMVAMTFVLPLFVGGPRLAAWLAGPLGLEDTAVSAWRIAYWPTVVIVGLALLTTFYHWVPAWSTPWLRDVPGAVLAGGLWLGGGAGLRLYAAWTIESNSAYGPLAAPIVVLLWLYIGGLALLMGAELNAEIEKLWPTPGARDAPLTDDAATAVEPAVPSSGPASGPTGPART